MNLRIMSTNNVTILPNPDRTAWQMTIVPTIVRNINDRPHEWGTDLKPEDEPLTDEELDLLASMDRRGDLS